MTDTTRANLIMAAALAGSLIAVNMLGAGCGVPADETAVAESAAVSTDPCGVTISPYNPACTKRPLWTCAQYNSVTHRCQRARGTQKLPGSWWVFKSDPGRPDLSAGSVIFYPAWGETLTTDAQGVQDAQVVPRNFSQQFWQPLLDYGWSYSTNDLTPCCLSGLQTMGWEYVEFYNGAGGCLYAGSGYTSQIGCWQSAGPVLRIEMAQVGNPIVRSFFTF